ncbi:hypothetical protein [Chryseobacterium sp. AG363]|uniref:hypothetical protein n=1 Tax=Chryseobacterium sp. AG363 TaxID=2183997 RepID=UPI000FF0E794|nr:hypothetical protein [Chryseobacterium sp. AG363]RKE78606.1 hypothetical protein DEU39_2854 [Chryseobacterium sp. AG363]
MNDMENSTTDVPVENTPSQTLFRFVSLRSPELSDDTKKDKRFIVIPQDLKNDNAFYVPVVNGTGAKQKLLKTCAANYANNPERISTDPNSANSLEGFKRTYKAYYVFGTWLAKNKTICTYEEVIAKRAVLTDPQATPATPPLISLWNNLIYQVVTQKDFYVKEVIMQVLLAHHILSVSDKEEMKTALGARVVLPKELMMDDKALSNLQPSSRMVSEGPKETFPTQEMQQQQLISAAKIKLERYEALKKNLSSIERLYKAEYQKEYAAAEEIHQKEIAPLIEQYNKDVIANKDRYCQVRNQDIKYDPADPCQQIPEIPKPQLPKLNFQFRQEIEADSLLRAIKPENLDTFLDVLGYDFQKDAGEERSASLNSTDLNILLEGRNTFSEIDILVKEAVEKSNNIIVENTNTEHERYTSIGGVLIPVARTVAVPFTYQICPKYVHKGFTFDIALTVPDSSWEVSNISYNLTPGNGSANINSDYYVKSRSGNIIFLNDLCMPGLDFNTIQDASLSAKIMFTNGKLANIYASKLQARACLSDKFLLEVDEGEPVDTEDENNFIPSGFGFKQIGIADYLKVEQTTHAYVEGEVAHIENIMAREYREKSTRKLRRSENTTTTSSDTEREQLTDTTTATRFEMQNEIAKMMQEASDSNTQFGINASYKTVNANINTSLGLGNASHSSRDESTRQAVTQAQDITARAMDRIVTKVHEERIEKIIEEFEENNTHGFDNKKGDKHVVGVYRWVDKLMKNQIYDYGKRMMFEFMIPEPAKLHLLGIAKSKFVKPEDPRTSDVMPMKDHTALENDVIFKYWAGKYNITADKRLKPVIYISNAFSEKNLGVDNEYGVGRWTGVYHNNDFKIPENYEAIYVKGSLRAGAGAMNDGLGMNSRHTVYVCGKEVGTAVDMPLDSIKDKITISFISWDMKGVTGSLVATCQLTQEAKREWQQETFKAIIDAYEVALIEYNNAVSQEENKASAIKGSNPNFYRQIENTVLRKNCISYMADRAPNAIHGYGLSGLTQGSSFTDYETKLSKDLDKYSAFVKFMEQAFEWENLSYYLYPYYWGNKHNWSDLYKAENTDPVFTAFLQSGMARVVVTVRPGFEGAVQFYLATGKIWNGGEVPVIGDDLYLSIVDEMKQPKGKKHGKAWITRLPTTLNILQAESIGLKVAHALPFTEENPDDFEVPSEVITKDRFNFDPNDNLLGLESLEGQKVISGDWK